MAQVTKSLARSRKLLLSAAIVAVLGSVAGFAVYSAFSSQTTNTGSSFSAGTVQIGSNDAGSALYSLANQKPGDTVDSCIKVTYTGTLGSDVKLYMPDSIGTLGQFLTLTVTPGTQAASTFPSCTGFTADAGGAIYNGTLAAFAAAHSSWTNGLVDNPGATATKWVQSDAVVYKFTLTLADNNAANAGADPGLTTGSHRFTFEARNQ